MDLLSAYSAVMGIAALGGVAAVTAHVNYRFDKQRATMVRLCHELHWQRETLERELEDQKLINETLRANISAIHDERVGVTDEVIDFINSTARQAVETALDLTLEENQAKILELVDEGLHPSIEQLARAVAQEELVRAGVAAPVKLTGANNNR